MGNSTATEDVANLPDSSISFLMVGVMKDIRPPKTCYIIPMDRLMWWWLNGIFFNGSVTMTKWEMPKLKCW